MHILQNSITQREEYLQSNQQLLTELSHHQTPHAFFLTCADSRIMPERLFGLRPGDFFTLRNAGNIIPPIEQADMGVGIIAALEFALLQLQVNHIIVCGHTDCGAVQTLDASLDQQTMPNLSRWVELLRPAQQTVDARSPDLVGEERHQAIVNQNVLNQLERVAEYPFVREAIGRRQLQLHGWVYDLYGQHVRAYDPATQTWQVL